ncbi:tRNA lysidine(34) synthetase TilS [Pseudogemmobacter bohemicus]|uniref:tRNA lysidine(34) synthetase TilS n=1 Tax=Pseudogemmobacter bohemicus TaxID=2250708 RepID=UPI000DD4CD02|nr:tRNA lysidine(34) synthetase TilS [Pseudogemmobacter bohemicus]
MSLSPYYRWLEHYEQADHGLLISCLPFDFRDQVVAQTAAAKIGIAVSGGGDSMALLHLIARVAPHWDVTVETATVNHHLRAEAADEADFVASVAAGLGLAHQTLDWNSHPEAGNLMQAAGRGRLDLLAAWAKARGIAHVFLAHTADDQAETFLIGLSRAAGLDGLTGMRRRFDHNNVSFWRPLLDCSRTELRDYLRRHACLWREDPSNDDPRYTRVRIRKALPGLAAVGITPDALNSTIRHLSEMQDLARQTAAAAFRGFGQEEAGALLFGREAFTDCHTEVQRRLISAAIRWISGNRHAPRANSVAQSLSEIRRRRGATLGGCLIRVTPRDIRLTREPRAVAGAQAYRPGAIWDHRWQITGPESPGATLAPLGTAGLAQLYDWRETGIRRDAALVSPALWQGDRLISAPIFPHFAGEWRATIYPSFGSFILSH